jgi:hypothetical protein
MSQNTDTPDTPPEVLARQGKSRALTPETAELAGTKTLVDGSGRVHDLGESARSPANTEKKAKVRAEAYAGGTPIRGLSVEQVNEIKGRGYEDAPKMEPELGDRTPAFVNWLWSRHPEDAKVRYAYRNIWPTTLPPVWPPKAKAVKKTETATP